MMHRAWLVVCMTVLLAGQAAAVEYRIEFEGFWDGSHVEAGALSGAAHFTTLIGATHTAGLPLWQAGGLASPGIEDVAEIGFDGTLASEIQVRIGAGTAGTTISSDGLIPFPSSSFATFEISAAHPNVSLISMVAPSPDWFVGVSDLALLSGGQWLNQLSVDLHPYDAGTENGSSFQLSNPPTVPPQPIALVGGSPFVGNPVIGRLHFTRVLSVPVPGSTALLGVSAAFLLLALRRGADDRRGR